MFADGLATYREDVKGSELLFEASLEDLDRAGSPFAGWATYYLAVCAYQRGDHPRVFELLAPVVRSAERYPSLAGKSLWLMGLSRVKEGRLDESLGLYLRALDRLEHEPESATAVIHLIAENFRYLGDTRRSWAYLSQALTGLWSVSNPDRVQTILQEAAEAALAAGEPAVALLFQDERVARLGLEPRPLLLALALYKRSVVRELVGDRTGAISDLTRAVQAADEISDEAKRGATMGYLLEAEGRLSHWTSRPAAVDAFSEAIRIWERTRYRQPLPALLLRRAITYVQLLRDDLAERDLRYAAAELRHQWPEVEDETLRASFRRQDRLIVEQLVQLVLRRAEPERALALAERMRSGGGLDVASDMAAMAEIREAQGKLPPALAVIEYLSLKDRLLVWVVRQDCLRLVELPIPRRDLKGLVERLHREIIAEVRPGLSAAARDLYRAVVLPVKEDLLGATSIVVIPDGILHRVPFAALVNPATGRYLVEERAIAKSPSLAALIEPLRHLTNPLGHEPSALIAGNPAFDRRAYSWLSSLPAAEREAEELLAVYPNAVSLSPAAATKDAFVAQAGDFEIVHFAGHAILNRREPAKSGLVFARGADADGSSLLTAEEIRTLRFARTRLVVLSACSTADGAGDDAMSLARAFLDAGVPSVLASLWRIDDEPTSELLGLFYNRLRSKRSPLGALRAAQLEMIGGARPPQDWASFELIGGMLPEN